MESAVQLISTVGFPIAAFLLMFWYMKTEVASLRDVISQNTETMREVLNHMRGASTDGT